jgi:hypothetical protein
VSAGPPAVLRLIKIAHTAAWAVFASAVVAIPPVAMTGRRAAAIWLIALVTLECLVLAANRMRCPLTDVAARYTADRRDNFDIYLPLALARYNKELFGTLFVADLLLVAVLWS